MNHRPALKTLLVLISFLFVALSPNLFADSVDRLRLALVESPASAQRAAPLLLEMGPKACRSALDGLINALRYDEESVYTAVSPAILAAGPDAVSPLERALSDSNFFVRRRAAELLGKLGPAARHATPALASLSLDPNADVHEAAANALIQIREGSVSAVAALLLGSDEQYRRPIVNLLGRLGPDAAPVLLERLRKDASPYIRTAAAEALVQAAPTSANAVKGLLAALQDLDEGVRAAVTGSLEEFGAAGQPAIGPLLVVAYEDRDSLTRQKAQQAALRLGPITAEGLAGLLATLRSPNVASRRDAMDMLAKANVSFKEAEPVLAIGMKDGDAAVRSKTADAAGSLAKESAESLTVLRVGLADAQPEVRSAAIRNLGLMKNAATEAVGDLLVVLKDPNPVLRREAVDAFAKLGPAGQMGLIAALKDPYDAIAAEAVKGLVALGPKAIPDLEMVQATGDPASKQRAIEALKRLRKTKRR